MLLRVFPRKTNGTPNDDLVRIGFPGILDPPKGVTEIHISVTFTWDIPKAKSMFRVWSRLHDNVKIGGPALDDPGDLFVPGRYLRQGHIITSRGCPNKCPFCFVPKREGALRELPITEGFICHDNNLLATSRKHFTNVCNVLGKNPQGAIFPGGLEAKRLTRWHAEMLYNVVKPQRMYFAYDMPGALKHIQAAMKVLQSVGFKKRSGLYCYVLIGFGRDTPEKAYERMRKVWDIGYIPFAMLYRDAITARDGTTTESRRWQKLKSLFTVPRIACRVLKDDQTNIPDRREQRYGPQTSTGNIFNHPTHRNRDDVPPPI